MTNNKPTPYEALKRWQKEKDIVDYYPKKYGHRFMKDSQGGTYALHISKSSLDFPTDSIYFPTFKEAVAYAKAHNPYEEHRREVAKRKEMDAIALLTSLGYKVTK